MTFIWLIDMYPSWTSLYSNRSVCLALCSRVAPARYDQFIILFLVTLQPWYRHSVTPWAWPPVRVGYGTGFERHSLILCHHVSTDPYPVNGDQGNALTVAKLLRYKTGSLVHVCVRFVGRHVDSNTLQKLKWVQFVSSYWI